MSAESLLPQLEWLRERLGRSPDGDPKAPSTQPDRTGPLKRLETTLGLSPFECQLVLLCAGVAVDGGIAKLVAQAMGADGPTPPDLSLALDILDAGHWDAISPAGPLLRWGIVHMGQGALFTHRPLTLSDRTLLHLLGQDWSAALVMPSVRALQPSPALPAAHAAQIDQVFREVLPKARRAGAGLPVVQLVADDPELAHDAAAHLAQQLGLPACLVQDHCPDAQVWGREWFLSPEVPVLAATLEDAGWVTAFADSFPGLLVVAGAQPLPLHCQRTVVVVSLTSPDVVERRALWATLLPDVQTSDPSGLDRLAAEFRLSPSAMARLSHDAAIQGTPGDQKVHAVWQRCRTVGATDLRSLARQHTGRPAPNDLLVPPQQASQLHDVLLHMRHRAQVAAQLGGGRGLGVTALFAGPSGTGKTLAAEVLATAMDLDLYRIDLSSVVSKYIGETEKNLGRVFDRAERGGVVLLFDEADALFGPRSEVKDSHDRHANVEVSYLLQRMEAFGGLAVLTSNLADHLDPAFLRRIQHVVEFPFPDRETRRQIWTRTLAGATVAAIDFDLLATVALTGGDIRSTAVTALVYAAEGACPLGMDHLRQAVAITCRKLGRPLSNPLFRGA